MKKIIAGPVIVFLAVALVYLIFFHMVSGDPGKTETESDSVYDRHYAMITGSDDSDFWERVYDSALEEGREEGVYVERFGANLAVEYDCNSLLELAIEASVDGIIVPGDEDEETVALLDQAVEQGIPVVTVLRDSTGSLRQCFVGNNSYNLGQEYGKQVIQILEEKEADGQVTSEFPAAGDEAEVQVYADGSSAVTEPEVSLQDLSGRVMVLIDESRKDTSQNLILLGIRETIEREFGEENGISVETKAVDDTRNFSSEESIRDIFLNSDELPDILICLSAVHTQCAYQAAVDYNKVGIVQILGYYDSDTILNAVSKNVIYATMALNTDQMGRLCVRALDEYVTTGYTNGYMAVETRLITAADAGRILAEE